MFTVKNKEHKDENDSVSCMVLLRWDWSLLWVSLVYNNTK